MNAQQLKNAILQEAITGRLVPQDPNDEPASVLLDRIRKEKAKLVKEGKLKKKDLEEKPISKEEIPFEIPESWEWCRWGMLGDYKKGPFGSSLTKSMFVPKSEDAIKVYEQKNAIQKDYTLGEYYISKEKYETMKGFTVHSGDIIVSCAGTIGETYLLPSEAPIGIINQALMRAKLHLDSIIPYWLLHFQYILLIENRLKGSGSAIKNIPPFEVLKAMPVPLPPLAEQHRIVAKIEELLPKVEEYGKAQEALDKLNAELPERLKKSILQEAITGKLVPQDPNDEPASVLLDRIRKEKAKLVKEGKLKKKDLIETPISKDEIPFEIPESWEWVRIGEYASKITDFVASGSFASLRENVKYYPNKEYAILVRTKDFQTNFQTDLVYTDKHGYDFLSNSNLFGGELILPNIGASIGKVFIVPKLNYRMTLAPNSVMIRFYWEEQRDWIFTIFSSSFGKNLLHDISSSTAQGKFNKTDFKNIYIPLPPLAEQHRIVAKIEELLSKIDRLKTK